MATVPLLVSKALARLEGLHGGNQLKALRSCSTFFNGLMYKIIVYVTCTAGENSLSLR